MTAGSGPLIRVEELTKYYRRPRSFDGFLGGVRTLFTREVEEVRAVDGVSFTIEAGELVGYLGPNGAGKSTTIKMMSGVLVPTSGLLEVNGVVPWSDRENNALQIGVVFGQRSQLWWDLPLIESFKLVGKLYRIPQATYRRNLDRFIEMLDLSPFLDRPVRQLSLGQRMRGDLVASMLHEPPLLYLDEPTIGLDALAKESMRVFVEEINRELNTTIVLTTHDLADVERLCDRVVLIDQGRVLYDGAVDRLKKAYAPNRTLVAQIALDTATGEFPRVSLDGRPEWTLLSQEGSEVKVAFDADSTSAQEVIASFNALHPVVDLSIVEPDLEGVVREIYGARKTVT
ncbi:ATP-binding cassette domain-containing protein [Streptomyces sp. NPDC057509]|uniref:ABC transporter ATP-binding protein n=1 Tax=Streptomyces sp. NPDC057509 TaxID=3346152 RepID=UPI00367D8FE4